MGEPRKVVSREERIKELEDVILDVLAGDYAWQEIQAYTGLSDQRCKDIEEIYTTILRNREG